MWLDFAEDQTRRRQLVIVLINLYYISILHLHEAGNLSDFKTFE